MHAGMHAVHVCRDCEEQSFLRAVPATNRLPLTVTHAPHAQTLSTSVPPATPAGTDASARTRACRLARVDALAKSLVQRNYLGTTVRAHGHNSGGHGHTDSVLAPRSASMVYVSEGGKPFFTRSYGYAAPENRLKMRKEVRCQLQQRELDDARSRRLPPGAHLTPHAWSVAPAGCHRWTTALASGPTPSSLPPSPPGSCMHAASSTFTRQ